MLTRKSHHKQFVSSHLEMFCHHQTLERGVRLPLSPSFIFFILFPVLCPLLILSHSLFKHCHPISLLSFHFILLGLYFAPLPTVRDVLLVWGSVQHHILIFILVVEKLEAKL